MPAEIRPPKILTPKNANCSSFTLVLDSIIPTIRPGVLRDDESNGEGLMREFQGRNSKFSDGGTLNCVDIDECSIKNTKCSEYAICTNSGIVKMLKLYF